MRAEVKLLRDELAERISRNEAVARHGEGVNQEIASLIAMVAAQKARQSVTNVQQFMSVSDAAGKSAASLSEQDFLELEMLQLENDELRCENFTEVHLANSCMGLEDIAWHVSALSLRMHSR
jgi:hypothetical protein